MSPPSNDDRRFLITLARRAIADAVIENRLPPPEPLSEQLHPEPGVFITLQVEGELRGCIGQMESVTPLEITIPHVAVNAALRDSRFAPITRKELDRLQIEISVLSPVEPIDLESIFVGIHGLLVENAGRRGVLLPQVATERRWTAQRFLEETCAKASLPPNAWKDPATRIYGFSVEVITEDEAELPPNRGASP